VADAIKNDRRHIVLFVECLRDIKMLCWCIRTTNTRCYGPTIN